MEVWELTLIGGFGLLGLALLCGLLPLVLFCQRRAERRARRKEHAAAERAASEREEAERAASEQAEAEAAFADTESSEGSSAAPPWPTLPIAPGRCDAPRPAARPCALPRALSPLPRLLLFP